MSLGLEWKKLKRTGFVPAFIGGAMAAGVVPVLNMAVRSEMYCQMGTPPVQTLLNANWQMMAMLNILLVVIGSCIMYHTEYADNAMQKLCALPITEGRIFWEKSILMAGMCMVVMIMEGVAIGGCVLYWFGKFSNLGMVLIKNFSYFFLLMMPVVLLSLLIASVCKNMWISLGIGVVCVFTATMLPMNHFVVSLFPYALPFQVFAGTSEVTVRHYMLAAGMEIIVVGIAEMVCLKVRRFL